MPNKQPLVSIIIPNFNREKVVKETLSSVKNQSLKNWECIIVDDGSTDNSLNIIKEFIKQDSRFLLKQRNLKTKGAPVCRNIGFRISTGSYILFLDSDDIIANNFIESQVKLLSKSNQGAAISKILRFQDKVEKTKNWYSNNEQISLIHFLKGNCTWRTSCVVWKREATVKLGKFNTNLKAFQDWLLYIKHFANNDSFIVNNETTLYYRENWNKDQISTQGKVIGEAYCKSRISAFNSLFYKILTNKEIRNAFYEAYCINIASIKSKTDIIIVSLQYFVLNKNIKSFLKAQTYLFKQR